jgi:uncharacterized protein (TIGR02145 family)
VGKSKLKRVLFLLVALFLLRFSISSGQAVKDADGNIYLTVQIGKQVWMAENLRTTKLNDGKTIPLVSADEKWKAMRTPAYCLYKNEEKNKDVYGALYNYYTVKTRKLCPVGWHVPTDPEWAALVDYLGDPVTAGDKLKEPGTDHWQNIFSKASNDFDFTGRPGGMRFYTGIFPEFGDSYAVWWTSTEFDSKQTRTRGLHDQSSMVYNGYDNFGSGFSVRCLKD